MRRLSPTALGTQLTPYPGSYHPVGEPSGLLTLRLSSRVLTYLEQSLTSLVT